MFSLPSSTYLHFKYTKSTISRFPKHFRNIGTITPSVGKPTEYSYTIDLTVLRPYVFDQFLVLYITVLYSYTIDLTVLRPYVFDQFLVLYITVLYSYIIDLTVLRPYVFDKFLVLYITVR